MRADEFIELAVTKSGDRRSYDAVEDSWEGLASYYGNLCSSRTISPRGIVPEIIQNDYIRARRAHIDFLASVGKGERSQNGRRLPWVY